MKKLKICDSDTGVKEPIEVALRDMTDNWAFEGNCSAQTVIDMRDALRELLDWKKRVEVAANEVIDDFHSYNENLGSIERLEKELGE